MIQELNKTLDPTKTSPSKNQTLHPNRGVNESPRKEAGSTTSPKPSPSKNKYVPSRYGANEVMQSNTTLSKTAMLNELQVKMENVDDELAKMSPDKINNRLKEMKSYHPPTKPAKVTDFKSKPIKKAEMDFLTFKEIFVAPKEKVLHDLREKEKVFSDLMHKGASKQYDKIIGVEKDESKNIGGSPDQKKKLEKGAYSTPKLLEKEALGHAVQKELGTAGTGLNKDIYKSHDKLQIPAGQDDLDEQAPVPKKSVAGERAFFEQQIQVQPPETPNYTTASPLTPGNGWAPSIPLIRMVDPSKSNVKDLLVRAKAGMQAGDVQKEAHLSFYLGMVHETKKEFKQAIRAYRKFLTCAQSMEDKIGVALAMNRLGVNYFNLGRAERSVDFHLKNLELSDRENCFAAYYNLGISYRSMRNYDESLRYLQTAFEWSREFKDIESECLSTGQLGITCMDMGNYEAAMENFKDCHDLSVKLNNLKLQLDCLLNMSRISKLLQAQETADEAQLWTIYERAYDCAKGLGENQTANLCICNMGVIEGTKKFEDFARGFNFEG